ncbi:MAG: hypothetical protein AABX05_05500 [Nanoarchaeota archaeon]
MNPKYLKLLGIGVLVLLLLNLLLFALGNINLTVFWGIIAAGLLFVYVILPRLKK